MAGHVSNRPQNGCVFNVRQNEFGDVSYHRLGDTFCEYASNLSPVTALTIAPEAASGGTQQWEQLVGRFCVRSVSLTRQDPLTPRHLEGLLENFYLSIEKFATDRVEPIILHSGDAYDGIEPFAVSIPYTQSKSLFTRALGESLRVAEAKITEAARLSPSARVVLSGGSGTNAVVQGRLRGACTSQGLPQPLSLYEAFDFHEFVLAVDSFSLRLWNLPTQMLTVSHRLGALG